MNCLFHRYCLLILVLLSYGLESSAQTANPCGVVAKIYPSAADSVVASGTTITFLSTSTNASSVKWLYDGVQFSDGDTLWNYQVTTGVHKISLVAFNGNCSDTVTVVYFSAGTYHNVDSLLLANYGTYLYNEEGTCIDKTSDGGFVLGGVQYLWGADCGEAGIVVKTRDKGCIDWSKKFLTPYYCNTSKITAIHASADSNYYVAINNLELARLDKNGDIIWNNKYDFNQSPIGILNVYGDPQGAIYTVSQAFNNGWMITKLDKNGFVTWNKFFRLSYDVPTGGPEQPEYVLPRGMVWLKGKLYVCGNAYSKANASYFGFITKLDAATGAKEWQYGYNDPNFPDAALFTHLALYDTLLMASSGAQGQIITLIDQQGVVRKNIKAQFGSSYGPKVTKAGADNKGHIYLMQWTEESLPLQPYYWYATNFAEIDTSLHKYWGMVFAEYSRSFFADATMGTDNKFGAVGQNFGYVDDGKYGSRDFSFLKVDTVTSEQFCFYNGTDYTLAEEPINRLDFQYNTDSSLSITPGLATPFTTVDAYIQTRYTCPDYIDSCSFMKISGPTAMCSISDIYTYRVHRNRKCTLQPKWILSPGISIVNQTDSTLSVRFPGLGNYKIISVLLGCVPIKDSLIITLASTTLKPDLGNDTVICNNTIIPLHAGKGFLTYRWMDGTTDPVLNAKQSGIYWVEVTDSCSNILRDSILISPFNLAINIGPDRKKCNNDTLHLNAPDGFLNYEWSNNYNISATNTQLVVVNPLTDTLYYLKAEKLPGCFAYDTVGIKVKISPSIQLGPDKSFCKGDSAWLNAGAGFAQYHWSNGTSAQQILVFNTGIYSIIATTAAGCKSYDTLNILNVWTNPVVRLDHNPDLCKGATRTLQAGNYSSYLWQDGSTSSSFIAKAVGTYYVTVTDSYQCKGRDTVWIVRLLPLPANFLPADTAICSYGEVVLNTSQTYSTYLWSNGNTGAATTITQPGLYWLQVTDANSCAGKDSVIVLPKDCMKGVYVPTAFSPNQDGKNDVFKPLIFGDVKSFQWVVYNRFGQIVFSTDNVSKGWDGTVKGIPQNTGGFTWVCHYQFAGEAARVKSGAVLLIR